MRRLLIPAMALGLLIAAPSMASAAPRDHNNHAARANREDRAAARANRNTRANRTRANRATPRATRTRANRTVTRRTAVRRNGVVNRRVTRATTRHRVRNRTVIRHNTRANVTRYRGNFRAAHRYRFANWRRPGNWYYRRWAYGQRLPYGWYGSSFWLTNYIAFGLMAPPYDYQWIRQGNDAVLVDIETGEVLRVEYDVFY